VFWETDGAAVGRQISRRDLARPACAKQGALERFEFLEPSRPVPATTRFKI
jgi:hypothetical protein